MTEFSTVTVTPKAETLLRGGHVWVYADEITAGPDAEVEDGSLVCIRSAKGKFLGTGFFNSHSKIRVRLISRNPNDRFDRAFWERRLRWAIDYRHTVMGEPDFSCCRLIFGEADTLPGLTVDRFGDVLVIESLCLGTDRLRDLLYPTIARILREEYHQNIRVIYLRNDSPIRKLEGMEPGCGFYAGEGLESDTDGLTEICENGIFYEVDYINGQKTGFFLDQKYNRNSIRPIAKGKRVLDCFTHTGSFGLNAAAGDAQAVTSVDVSADALRIAAQNAVRNGFSDRISYLCEDVFDLLARLEASGQHPYDFIILDPPAFTKSRDTLRNAIKGYREINTRAMRILPRGGYLATCSCSHFMTETYFKQMLHNAAADAGVSLRQIEARQQSPDHPILWNVPETDYLKFFIFQIV